MLLRTRFIALCLIAPMVLLAFSGSILACTQPQAPRPPANPPPPPTPCYKLIDGLDGQGRTRVFVWCVIKRIFNTTTPHSCACGHGFAQPALLPLDTVAVAAQVGVFDVPTQTMVSSIPQFDALVRTPTSDPILATGPGPTQQNPLLPQLNAASPGSTWFGFGGTIQPVTAPFGENGENLPAGRVYVICFEFRTLNPNGLMNAILGGTQIAAGLGQGDPNNTPLFDQTNDHSVTYSTLPEPASMGIFALAAAGMLFRRRAS